MLDYFRPSLLGHAFGHPLRGFKVYTALSSGIWVVVLPVVFFTYDQVDVVPTTILISAFALCYPFLMGSLSYYPHGWSRQGRYLFALSIIVGFGVISIPIVGYQAPAFLPFAASLISWGFSLATATATIIALGVILVGISHLVGYLTASATGDEYSVITLFWAIFVCFLIQIGKASREANRLSQEIELSRQRESIARDVHDVLGHSLTVISLKSEVARRLVRTNPTAAEQELEAITALARTSLAEVRSTVTRMRHPDLAGELAAASRAFHTAGINAALPDDISGVVTNAKLFSWVVREATTNIIRHAQARNVQIDITPSSVRIVDDGVGFRVDTLESAQPGTESAIAHIRSEYPAEAGGLAGLSRRVQDAGGHLIIDSSPQSGTRITVTMTSVDSEGDVNSGIGSKAILRNRSNRPHSPPQVTAEEVKDR